MIYKMKNGQEVDLKQIESVGPIKEDDYHGGKYFDVNYKSGRCDCFEGQEKELKGIRKEIVDAWRRVAHDYEKR